MKILILGAGWYGCHLARALRADGCDVFIVDKAGVIFAGASGGIPARVHLGFHYPRSAATRSACLAHQSRFMAEYGHLTAGVPVNLYAIAAHDSLLDFGTYVHTLAGSVPFLPVRDPAEYGLQNVEGAVLTGERHVITRKAREFFARELGEVVSANPGDCPFTPDWTIDATFCARESAGVDRYEPCVTALLRGPTDRAVTVMDGPFPSVYPWDEERGLLSLTSAKFTPLARCATRQEAEEVLAAAEERELSLRCQAMLGQIAHFWPIAANAFELHGWRLSIRAMPRSGADARLVDIVEFPGNVLRVRAGKIDAVLDAEDIVKRRIFPTWARDICRVLA